MLFGLIVVFKIDVLELFGALMTNVALFVIPLKMSSELINIIEELPTEGTGGMEKYKISMLAELSLLDMSLIGGLRVENLLRVNTLAVVETYVTVHFLMFEVEVFFNLVEAVEQLLALLEGAVVACLVLYF